MSSERNADLERFSASFKPAPARSSVSWALEGDTLLKNGKRAIDLSEVTGGNWMTVRHKGVVTRTLKLKSPNGNTSISAGAFGVSQAHADHQQLAVRALVRVTEKSPEARFNMAGGMGVILMLFFFSLVVVAIGTIASIASFGPSNEGGVGLLIFGVVIIAGGLWGAWSTRPWGVGTVSAAQATVMIAQS